jgi:hypothetical protein
VHERPATSRRSHGYSHRAWLGTIPSSCAPSLESQKRPGRALSTLLKKLVVSRGTIGRVCRRTRSCASIGRRRRMGAPEITQPGAYIDTTQPWRSALRTSGPMQTARRNNPVCRVLALANHGRARAVCMSWPPLNRSDGSIAIHASVRMDSQLAMQPWAGATVVLAHRESNGRRLRVIYTLAVPLAPKSSSPFTSISRRVSIF